MELSSDGGQTLPQAMLARRVRRLREQAGLTLRELGEQLNFPHSYLHRVETGKQLPSDELTAALEKQFGCDGVLMDLLELAHNSAIRDYSRRLVEKEPEAERIRTFTSSLVPGLLQTEEYARELTRRTLTGEPEGEREKLVAARMRRQRIFERPEAPYHWVVIDEAALKRPVGGAEVMAGQLRHLVGVAARSRTTVQVLPFGQGAYSMMGGSLNLLTLRDGTTLALVESFASGSATESTRQVVELSERFDQGCSLALPKEHSLDLIRSYLREFDDEYDS